MKDLKQFLLESKKHIDQATVADFYQWSCCGEAPTGDLNKNVINAEDIEMLIDNGWFNVFNDEDTTIAAKKAADWFKKNWTENIKVESEETPNDWEVSFELNGTTYSAAFTTYFGDTNFD